MVASNPFFLLQNTYRALASSQILKQNKPLFLALASSLGLAFVCGQQPVGGQSPVDFEKNMVLVEEGRMTLGQNASTFATNNETLNTEPEHDVHVDAFYISKYEVTQADWMAVMGTNPSKFAGCDDCPVESVSWDDVQVFIQKLSEMTGQRYRLPSEAEWEFAARGGTKSRGFECAGSDDAEEVAWFDNVITTRSTDKYPRPVGQKKSNELGLYDMSGNVKEWCADGWHDNYNGAPSRSIVWEEGARADRRVVHGGSFGSTPTRCRTTARDSRSRSAREMTTGFRLARD